MVDTTRRIVIEVDNTGARADIAQTDRAMTGLGRTADGVNNTFNRLSAAASAVAAALATSQIIAYADAWTVVNNRLANSIRESETLADVTERVFSIANDTRSSLDATAALYQSLERSTRELGVSTDDLATITTNLNRAFIVSGASVVDAENATRQLGQALAAGALRGDEYNSIAENGSRITIALAESLGVGVGELRELAAQGALTSEVFVEAFTSIETTTSLLDEYNNVSVTFAQNTQVATNNLTRFIGESATVESVVGGIGQTLVVASENLNTLLDVATVLASVFVARLTPAIIANITALTSQIAASTRATVTTNAFGQVISRTTVAANAGALAMRGLAASMALVGGPVGIAIIAATALFAFSDSANEAAASTDSLGQSVGELTTQFRALSAVELAQSQAENQREIAELEDLLAGLRLELNATAQEQQEIGQPINTSAISESILIVENDLLRARREAEALNLALGNIGVDEVEEEISPPAISIESQLAYEQFYQSLRDARALQLEQNQIDNETELQQTYDLTLEQQLIYEEYYASLREAQAQSSADLIAQEEAKNQALIALSGNLGTTLVSLANGNSKALFNIGKVAAIASATLAARTAIPEAYEQGTRIGGPPLGSIYAAVAATATAAQVAQVASTQFSSSGGVSSVGASAVSTPTTTTSTATSTAAETTNQRFVEIRGLSDDQVLTGAQVKDLMREYASSDDDIIVSIANGQTSASREGLI